MRFFSSGGGAHADWLSTQVVQSCFAGTSVLSVYMTTDPYGVDHRIDDIQTNNKEFSGASDNGNGGSNAAAGPDATTDPTLLPPLIAPSTVSG